MKYANECHVDRLLQIVIKFTNLFSGFESAFLITFIFFRWMSKFVAGLVKKKASRL